MDRAIAGIIREGERDHPQADDTAKLGERWEGVCVPKPVMIAVDDDAEVLRSVERDLRKRYAERYKILRADSASQALAALGQLKKRNEQVALLLVDQRMPVTTGV